MDEKPTLDYETPSKPEQKSFWDTFWGQLIGAAIGEIGCALFAYILLPLGIIYLMSHGCWSSRL